MSVTGRYRLDVFSARLGSPAVCQLWLALGVALFAGCDTGDIRDARGQASSRGRPVGFRVQGTCLDECLQLLRDQARDANIVLLAKSVPATPISAEAERLGDILKQVADQADLTLRSDPEAFVLLRAGHARRGSFVTADEEVTERLKRADRNVDLDLKCSSLDFAAFALIKLADQPCSSANRPRASRHAIPMTSLPIPASEVMVARA